MSSDENANNAQEPGKPEQDDVKRQEANRNSARRKQDNSPVEDLYDLSQPIPKASKPDKDANEEQLSALDATFDKLREERRLIQEKVEEAMDNNKRSEIGKEREAFGELRDSFRALIEEKKLIRSKLQHARNQGDKIMKDKKDARSNIRFSSVEEIDKEIRRLQRNQETTSMSLSDEKRLIKDMDALKASKKFVVELKSKESAMEGVKEERKTIQALLVAKDKEIDAISKQMDDRQVVIKGMSEKESSKKEELQALFQERDEIRKSITETLDEKSAVRDSFREENNAWYDYQRALRAQKKIQYEDEKREREEEEAAYQKKLEDEEAKKIPYEEEQALCDYLVDYLTRTYLSDVVATEEKVKKSDVVAVKDDPFANFKPKAKKNEDEYFGKGKGKKKRVRTTKRQDQKNVGPFTLSVDTFEQFGLLGLSPPTSVDMVEGVVKDLVEKKEWYSKQLRGSVATAAETRKVNERAAAKTRQNGDSSKESTKSQRGKNKFSLSKDDFAPLGGVASSGVTALNSSWGQRVNEITLTEPTEVTEVDEAAEIDTDEF